MENATCRIPPIPLETLVVLAWLFKLLGRRFGATVMSPHGARTGGAKRQSAGCVRFCSRNPKRRLGGAKTVKYKRAADSASGTNAGRAGGAWCQNPGEFWDGGLALQSVTSWCQNWSSRVPGRRGAPAEKINPFSYFFAKSGKSVPGVTWVRTSFPLKVGATGVPPPNESILEQRGDQRFRI